MENIVIGVWQSYFTATKSWPNSPPQILTPIQIHSRCISHCFHFLKSKPLPVLPTKQDPNFFLLAECHPYPAMWVGFRCNVSPSCQLFGHLPCLLQSTVSVPVDCTAPAFVDFDVVHFVDGLLYIEGLNTKDIDGHTVFPKLNRRVGSEAPEMWGLKHHWAWNHVIYTADEMLSSNPGKQF